MGCGESARRAAEHFYPAREGRPRASMSSFATYIIGSVILVVGLAMAAYLLDVPGIWIAVGVVVALGIGVITATSRTKMKDPPGTS